MSPKSKKSSSPEAAQKKLWKLEIRDLEKAGKKIQKDFRDAFKASKKEAEVTKKAADVAHAKHLQFVARMTKQEPAALKKITSRIAQLNGRIGL